MDIDVIRKKFEINIKIKKWYYNKTIKVSYQQATMYDIMEFLYESEKPGFTLLDWIIDFVQNNTKQSVTIFDRRIISIKSQQLFENIQDTYFKGAFEKTKDNNSVGDKSVALVSSYIVFLSSELKQDPLYLMKNYTMEQLKFFTEGLTWNINEKTPEGQKKNRLSIVAEKSKNIDVDATRKLLSTIDEKKCNEVFK